MLVVCWSIMVDVQEFALQWIIQFLFSLRYWEAIKKWDEAIQFTPADETLLEMKAQVHPCNLLYEF